MLNKKNAKILKIVQIGHPVLQQVTRMLDSDELQLVKWQDFIDDLIATMHHANGAGLAANQVNMAVSICAIEVKDNPRYPYKPNIPLTILVNPVIVPLGKDTYENNEGCLSVPGIRGVVQRYKHIKVKSLNRFGEPQEHIVNGLTAGTFQHEVDHLLGFTFMDKLIDSKSVTTWENFEEFYKQDYIQQVMKMEEDLRTDE